LPSPSGDLVHSLAFSPDGNLLSSVPLSRGSNSGDDGPKDVQNFQSLRKSLPRQCSQWPVSPIGKWRATIDDIPAHQIVESGHGQTQVGTSFTKGACEWSEFFTRQYNLASGSSADKTYPPFGTLPMAMFLSMLNRTGSKRRRLGCGVRGRQSPQGGADNLIRICISIFPKRTSALKEIRYREGPARPGHDSFPMSGQRIIWQRRPAPSAIFEPRRTPCEYAQNETWLPCGRRWLCPNDVQTIWLR